MRDSDITLTGLLRALLGLHLLSARIEQAKHSQNLKWVLWIFQFCIAAYIIGMKVGQDDEIISLYDIKYDFKKFMTNGLNITLTIIAQAYHGAAVMSRDLKVLRGKCKIWFHMQFICRRL